MRSFYLIHYLFKEGINKDPPSTESTKKWYPGWTAPFPRILLKGVIVGDKILLVQLVVPVSTLLLLRILRVIPNGEGRRERKFKNSLQRLDYRDSGVWIESGSAPYTENI